MTLDELSLEKKLENATNSQDCIQSLSLWILHHKNHHKRIVKIWMKCFERAKSAHRLTLFHLANDVLQHAKRKGVPQYLDDFALCLKSATALLKGDKICDSIDRVFNIWHERGIYSDDFIDELKTLLSNSNVRASTASKIVAEFKLSELIEKIKKMKKVESNALTKLEALINCNVDASSSEVLNKLKDKTHGEQFSKDFDDATKCLETVISALEKEVSMRRELVEGLEKSEIFYETQKEEAKIVANAYRNFNTRVKSVKKSLNESRTSLPSPLPSPPKDAPSPTNSDDGPHLPGNDFFQINPFVDPAKSKSSLDQRLSNLMHNIPQFSDQQKVSDNYTINSNNNNNNTIATQMHTPIVPIPGTGVMLSDPRWNTTDYSYLSHQNISSNYDMPFMHSHGMQSTVGHIGYDYNSYPHQMGDNRNSDIQPIQSVVSSRLDDAKSVPMLNPPINIAPYNYHGAQQTAPENFESTDMDLGNSDEEENGMRSQTHNPNLKVIETRHASNHNQPHDFKINNGNFERSYSHNPYVSSSFNSSTHIKSIARMPDVRMNINSQSYAQQSPVGPHQWRGPRSAIVAPSHYSQNSLNMNAPHNRQWRPPHRNKGSRKGFRRF